MSRRSPSTDEAWERIRFQSELLEAVGQAVVATDLEGRVLYWNRSAEELYGWTEDEAGGRDIQALVPSAPSPTRTDHLVDSLQESGRWTREIELERKDGSTFPGLVTVTPITDGDGRLAGTIAVSSNIREMKELEAHLRHSQKMEAVGRLAAGIAHDFNNLLTVIGSHAQMILEDLPTDSPTQDEVRQIQKEIGRATRLTRQLLAFGRRQATEERVVSLEGIVHELQPMLRRLIPSRIELEFEGPDDPLPVQVDPSQMEQVVVNLAVNAADAIDDEGRITMSVDRYGLGAAEASALEWPIRPGVCARLTVTDSGHGMNAEVLERIFEPFFSTKPEGEGSGLGLSTVFGIVRKSRGCVLVESEPDQGSRFQVLLPLTDAPRSEAGGEGATEPPAVDEAHGPRKEESRRRIRSGEATTVLVVDDTPAILRVARRSLERAGYRTLLAGNGKEALQIMAENHDQVDVVVSDVVMPQLGGAKLIDHLRRSKPDLPIILTSGHSDRELSEEVRNRASGFLAKPFGPAELVDAVREALNGS